MTCVLVPVFFPQVEAGAVVAAGAVVIPGSVVLSGQVCGASQMGFLRKVDWPSDVLGRQCRVCLGILVAGQSTVVRDVEEYLLLCTASHHIGVCVFRSNQDVTFRGVCAVVAKTDTVTV